MAPKNQPKPKKTTKNPASSSQAKRKRSNPIPERILRGGFQNFNPLCGRNPIETDLD